MKSKAYLMSEGDQTFETPSGSAEKFEKEIASLVGSFANNRFVQTGLNASLTMNHYHSLLLILFHQVWHSSSSFAIAGGNLSPERTAAKFYLMKHADEEKSHWQWILSDLANTGYKGPDPRSLFPPPATSAYVAFNYYVAARMPIARLGIAMMLETLGSEVGTKQVPILAAKLQLKADQTVFFRGHGETDTVHIAEMREALSASFLNAAEWGWMIHAAQTAFYLYDQMYNDAAK